MAPNVSTCRCCVCGKRKSTHPGTRLHLFPRDAKRRKQWVNNLNVAFLKETQAVCGDHFDDIFRGTRGRLLTNAVPRPARRDDTTNHDGASSLTADRHDLQATELSISASSLREDTVIPIDLEWNNPIFGVITTRDLIDHQDVQSSCTTGINDKLPQEDVGGENGDPTSHDGASSLNENLHDLCIKKSSTCNSNVKEDALITIDLGGSNTDWNDPTFGVITTRDLMDRQDTHTMQSSFHTTRNNDTLPQEDDVGEGNAAKLLQNRACRHQRKIQNTKTDPADTSRGTTSKILPSSATTNLAMPSTSGTEHSEDAAVTSHQDDELALRETSSEQILVEATPIRKTINWQEFSNSFMQVVLKHGDENTPQALDNFTKELKSVRCSNELNGLLSHSGSVETFQFVGIVGRQPGSFVDHEYGLPRDAKSDTRTADR